MIRIGDTIFMICIGDTILSMNATDHDGDQIMYSLANLNKQTRNLFFISSPERMISSLKIASW